MKLSHIQRKTQTTQAVTLRLSDTDILDLIEEILAAEEVQPKNLKVTFDVPSGGDYSGMRVPVSQENAVIVSYSIETLEANW